MSHLSEGRLHAYLEGECVPAEAEAVERHVEECPGCAARLEEARESIEGASELLSHLEPRPTPAPAWRELEERAAARRGDDGSARWWRPALAWAATVALAFGVGWYAAPPGGLAPEQSRVALSDQRVRDDRPGLREGRREAQRAPSRTEADAPEPGPDASRAQAAAPRAREERERAEGEALDTAAGRAASSEVRVRTLPIRAEEAALWLGGPLRELPGHRRVAVEVGPAALLPGAEAGLPVVRSVYEREGGARVVLYQQPLPAPGAGSGRVEDAFAERPAQAKRAERRAGEEGVYRWRREGYLLAVEGPLSADSLRALARGVR